MTPKNSQTMKPATAAKKLGIYLPAAPQEFQDSPVTREAYAELQANPPEWLAELRRNGPHPRPVVAQKLNVSISGLTRGGITEPLTTAEIAELLQSPPQWLVVERATHAAVRAETLRVKEEKRKKAATKEARENAAAKREAPKGTKRNS
ncbi:hypothetical protein DM794_10700 [Paenarthrobacter ureafaciens]|jgi:hypothetical protein|uniref:DUF5997 family protein n=1 Tax=Paenarthrobacter ureafaciens TaxID=37931 RepID=A0AAX3EIC7_PAEUR|nr:MULTISPECIES: DUF5997 family protein [Paenarthrobacter]AMB38832.1 hypothetical protein AUT26_00225 [Arthrobacter sp. ATCC 21022]NKR11552.1 hypothetical protein [Arthrobacter sp. M5]NKR16355.1 hypothetical protein [Arthrobacter sp. M6]OEH57585.1 hypothetical protein A5N13_08515 [Arthrobacter sp. D4]OEH58860.1 hypothetical protein A5N17_20590 [Arthrobacter sp. D2]BCW82369.1 hypothetical protein NicSoilE8_00420 [Arthrobacter sp. NicSoilE8]